MKKFNTDVIDFYPSKCKNRATEAVEVTEGSTKKNSKKISENFNNLNDKVRRVSYIHDLNM